MTLDLQDNLDAFEGGSDDGLGDGGEGTGGADLADGVLLVDDGTEGFDDLFAKTVALGHVRQVVSFRW